MTTIQILLAIINGKGHPNFWWEVAVYMGNDGTETIHIADTFSDALAYKVNHKDSKNLFIDLWYCSKPLGNIQHDDEAPQLLGDKFSEFDKKIREIICTDQNIVLSLQQ